MNGTDWLSFRLRVSMIHCLERSVFWWLESGAGSLPVFFPGIELIKLNPCDNYLAEERICKYGELRA
jgi:hypothetical protein